MGGTHEHPVGSGIMVEFMAPCPNCERGRRIEFGSIGAERWGPQGYWRGRPAGIERSCMCGKPKVGAPTEARQWYDMLYGGPPVAKTKIERADTIGEVLAATAPDVAPATDSNAEPSPPRDEATEKVLEGDAGAAGATHDCPDVHGRTVPWSLEECAHCTPATPEEEITL